MTSEVVRIEKPSINLLEVLRAARKKKQANRERILAEMDKEFGIAK